MTYQDILSSVYSFVTSAGGTELLSRNDIVNFMNMAIGNLVAISDWSFLKDEKTITSSVPSTTFTLPCELYNEYTVYGIKDGAETLLSPSGGVPETREYDVSNLVFTTYEEYDSVRIHGNWGMATIENTDEFIVQEIPLPNILLGALYNYTIAYALPVYIDTGHTTARYHYDLANILVEAAAKKFAAQKSTNFVRPTR